MKKCIFCNNKLPVTNSMICSPCRSKYKLSESENKFIDHFLDVSFNEYTEEERSICMSCSTESVIGNCRKFLNDLVIALYCKSNRPLDILATAMTYARMYAEQRPLAIKYFEMYRQTPVEIPKIYHLAYDDKISLDGRQAYSLWRIFSTFSNIYEAEKHYNEAIKCLKVCIEADKGVNPSDFERIKKLKNKIVSQLYEEGRFDEADCYAEEFNDTFPVIDAVAERHKRDIEKALTQGYDLIKYVNNGSCCLECALRRNRVYSISGNDTRFPKYSEYHCSCYGITIIPFNEEDSKRWSPNYDYIKESNRPFIDNRTDEEKERYQFDCDRKVYEEILERDKKLFNKMKAIIPDFPFKSFRSYRSSSKEKIKEYAKIAINYEMNILPTEEEEEIIERYLKTKKEKGW